MEDGDLERWQELSGFADDSSASDNAAARDEDGCGASHIEHIVVQGDTFVHRLAGGAEVSVQHDTAKGLSFQIWPSSLTLAQYAEQQERQSPGTWKACLPSKGVRVLELGCGCGLSGLAFAALGAAVALTDLPETMALLERNIDLNAAILRASGGSAQAFPVVWGETDVSSLPAEWQRPDLVIAADVVYHRHLFSPLLATLAALAGGRCGVLLAHVRRWKSDRQFFAAARRSFLVEDVTAQAGLPCDERASHTKGALRLFKLLPNTAV